MTNNENPASAAVDRTDRLRRWNRWAQPLVIVAAILPLGPIIAGGEPATAPAASVAVACWLMFVIDFVAQHRLQENYLSCWQGRVYLAIVVVTAPIYLVLPALDETDLLVLARVGWVAVLVAAAAEGMRGVGRLARRLGLASLYGIAAVCVGAVVVTRVEGPDEGFETFGDGLWWSIVTITTVGYGDLAPSTTTGRLTAVGLMVAGLAFLGVAAASLTAFFRLEDTTTPTEQPDLTREQLLQRIEDLQHDIAQYLQLTTAPASDPSPDTTPTADGGAGASQPGPVF